MRRYDAGSASLWLAYSNYQHFVIYGLKLGY